jgi:hypothetical protein
MKIDSCTLAITILHGRDKLHHLRTMAFMPIPYARSLLLARVALPLCVMIQTLDLPCARLHGTSRANRAKWQPRLVNV